ncbi:MAG: hypothetical protein H0T60_13555, partial [Acidobacteria bacterium]|nr:hypothetical protein [Acidobacteriota bacterium]
MMNDELRTKGSGFAFHSSFIIHHSSLVSQSVEFTSELLRLTARWLGELAAALCALEVLKRGDDFGALETPQVSAFHQTHAEVVMGFGAIARRAEFAERSRAVRRPQFDAAPV